MKARTIIGLVFIFIVAIFVYGKEISQWVTSVEVNEERANSNECIIRPFQGEKPYEGAGLDLRGGFICTFVIHEKEPIYTFDFDMDQNSYVINSISVITNGEVLQIIDANSLKIDDQGFSPLAIDAIGELYSKEHKIGLVEPLDYNFDGYNDLVITNIVGATGNLGRSVFIFDPTSKNFVWDSLFGDTGGIPVANDKKIYSHTNMGHAGLLFMGEEYIVVNGKPVLTKRVEQKVGSNCNYIKITSELINGKMTVTSTEVVEGPSLPCIN